MSPESFPRPGRADRMRPLNLPQAVVVETDTNGCPRLVCDKVLQHNGTAVEPRTYEVYFVIDVSGSMGPFLTNVRNELVAFADGLPEYEGAA